MAASQTFKGRHKEAFCSFNLLNIICCQFLRNAHQAVQVPFGRRPLRRSLLAKHELRDYENKDREIGNFFHEYEICSFELLNRRQKP